MAVLRSAGQVRDGARIDVEVAPDKSTLKLTPHNVPTELAEKEDRANLARGKRNVPFCVMSRCAYLCIRSNELFFPICVVAAARLAEADDASETRKTPADRQQKLASDVRGLASED